MKTKRLFFCLFLLTLALLLCACEKEDTAPEGPPTPTEGLSYTLAEDGKSYLVSGIGTATDTDIIIPTVYMGKPVVGFKKRAFCETAITSVYISYGVFTISEEVFEKCTALASVIIPASVTDIGYRAFWGCESLESITVKEGNTVYHSAGNCLIETKSKTLLVGGGGCEIPKDGSVTSIAPHAFWKRTSLTAVTIPAAVTSIGASAFSECKNLVSLVFEEGDAACTIGKAAFHKCRGLVSLTIPARVTLIDNGAFTLCTGLSSVVFSEGNEDAEGVSLGTDAFSTCSSLESVTFLAPVKSLGESAFWNCIGLRSVSLPARVERIGTNAFELCISYPEIYYDGSYAQWKTVERSKGWAKGQLLIHCTDKTFTEY